VKKIIIYVILSVTASVAFGQANVPAIVVSTFSTRGQAVTADDAESITELFIAELAKQSGVRVVDRTSIERVVAEMKFQTSDWSDPQKTARLGSALNAEILVRGQLNQLGQQISFAITALDIKTLEVVSSTTKTFNAKNIFTTEDGALLGDVSRYSSKKVIFEIAESIADPIKDKMGPNYFIGKWQTDDGNCILEFRADGTVRVERYIYGLRTYINGTGVYSFNQKEIEIILNLQGESITTRAYGRDILGRRYDYSKISYSFNEPKNNISFGEKGLMKSYRSNDFDSWYEYYTSLTKIQR